MDSASAFKCDGYGYKFSLAEYLDQWFSTGGPQHVSRVGHRPLCILKMGLHAEQG